MGSAVLRTVGPSLVELLKYEWGLDNAVKKGLRNLEDELMSMHAFLGDVSGMPPDHLESQVKIRACQVRDLSHAIEIRLHSFMTRIKSTKAKGTLLSATSKLVINHQMDAYIKETLIKVKNLREQHGMYPSKSALESTSARIGGTRMFDMRTGESNPVGLDGAIAELTKKLSKGDHVSIVGMAGMGKTTLAQAVYDKIKGDFDCKAFLRFGQGVDPDKVLTDIFCELHFDFYDKEPADKYQSPNIHQPISHLHLRKFIKDKRCLIVIDNILDVGTWNLVEGAFKDSAESKIITTTHNPKVAEEVGGIYPMEELSFDYSKKLLLTKAEATSDDAEFDIVADKILRKCGGVPIAITLVGCFLAKNKSKGWIVAYDSIGFDEHKEDGTFEHIKEVLSSSYYDLSYHVQRCFLYLSMFPEGHLIEKNMLIWRWVAEGLVHDGSFELGESYFNELLDRCMIQWAVSPRDIGQGGCRLHGLMLDLIRDLSSSEKENFSTVPGMKQESTSQTIHRLAIHQDQNQNTSLEVGEVLSFYASTCTGSFPALQKFKGLRVIDLERCDLSTGDCKLEHLGKLDGLGYIGLVGTPVAELPEKIGRLKLLQTLDVTATGITKLPLFVQEIVTLRCLRASNGTSMMGQVEKLTSLEELWLHSADKSPDFAIGLRKLSKMRVLVIHFDEIDDGMQEDLVESLHELKKLRVLQVWSDAGAKVRLGCWEGSVPSRQLRQLLLFGVIVPRRMPWIDRLYVPELSKLLLQVETLEAQDMKILGQMPSLGSLYLHSEDNCLSYIAGKDEFEELEYLNTNIELICGNGGLKKMQQLEVGGIWAGRDVGLQGNMPLLKRVTYHLDCQGCLPLRVEKAEEEIRKARETHPKRPDLSIRRWNNTVTEIRHVMELMKGTSPVTPRLDRPRALPSPSRARAVLRYMGNPAHLNMFSEGLSRLESAVGAPPALRVGDATDATGSPSQPQGPAFFENYFKKYLEDPEFIAFATQNEGLPSPGSASSSEDADASLAGNDDGAGPSREPPPPPEVDTDSMLCWLNSPDGVRLSSSMAARLGVGHDAYLMILQKCLRNPKMLATMSSAVRNGDFSDMASWFENNTVMMDLMHRDILGYFAKQHMDRQSSTPQHADGGGRADIASSSEAQAMGAQLPNKLGRPLPYWLNTPDGAACVSEGAAKFGINDVPYERVFKKCVLNPELIAAIHSAVQNDDESEFNQLMDQLIGPEIMNYFSEQDTDEEDMDGPPKRDIAGYLFYWLDSQDGATSMSDGAAKSGINGVAYERMCRSMLEPKFIAAVDRMGDAYEFYQLLRQPMDEEFTNYFDGQDIDEPSSTPGYAGGGRTDARSTNASPPESSAQDGEKALDTGASSGQLSSAQVNADSILSHREPADASNTLSGLPIDPALAAQSDMMDVVTSSTATASAAQSRQDGEKSSTIFNSSELPVVLEKASAIGESNGQPSSAQLDDVDNEEGDST